MRRLKFAELQPEHQREILSHLKRGEAESTVWELVPKFPVNEAAAFAWDMSVVVSERRVRDVVLGLASGNKLRPILMDSTNEDAPWIEGIHRSVAAERLKRKTMPALVRVL